LAGGIAKEGPGPGGVVHPGAPAAAALVAPAKRHQLPEHWGDKRGGAEGIGRVRIGGYWIPQRARDRMKKVGFVVDDVIRIILGDTWGGGNAEGLPKGCLMRTCTRHMVQMHPCCSK